MLHLEAKAVIDGWRDEYNLKRLHSSFGYRLPAPEPHMPPSPYMGCGTLNGGMLIVKIKSKLSYLVISIWIILLIIIVHHGGTHTQDLTRGGLAIWTGIYLIFMGVVVIYSHSHSQEEFIFKWISKIMKFITFGSDLIFWGWLAIILGILCILTGTGIVKI